MILLHLLNFFFRYDNMMIKKNHKASILIEIIVIKNTHKHWQPFLHLHSFNYALPPIQEMLWFNGFTLQDSHVLVNCWTSFLRIKISCRTKTFNNLIKQGTYKSNTFNKRKQQQEQTFVWDLWAWKFKRKKNKHNAELQRTDPGTKVTGELSARGHMFPPNVEMNSYYFHRFSWEKIHKMIGHMPWLYQ